MNQWIDILDVSAAQGVIDFQRVAAAKVAPGVDRRWRGLICKVSEGQTYKDPTRQRNIAGARAVGMPWGAYAFIHPAGDVRKQVENMWNAVGDTMPIFAPAFDLEAADPALTPQQLVDQLRRGRDAVLEWFGRLMLVYSYPDFWARRMMPAVALATDVAELPLWWAFYGAGMPWYPKHEQLPRGPEPWRSAGKTATLWQYSGNTKKPESGWFGHVDGIVGDVDRNVFVGSEDDFTFGFCNAPRTYRAEAQPQIVRAFPEMTRRSDD